MSQKASEHSLQSAVNEVICIRAYDPLWPAQFEKEKARLLGIFSGDLLEIEHIGSTAVPGLAAKPVIDILAGLRAMDNVDSLLAPLRDYGYATPDNCNDGLTERRWLMRHCDGHRTHHLHLVRLDGHGWKRTIRFRDILRAEPKVAKEYEDLKYRLARVAGTDRDGYIISKTEFVEDTLRKFPETTVAGRGWSAQVKQRP